jgi:O-antigen biosynthesis protein
MMPGSSVAFLLGVPRSGTTLLSLLLNQHEKLYCPPEPWLLLGLDALGQVPPGHAADPALVAGAVAEFLGDRRAKTLNAAAHSIYQQALNESGKSIFVDKTPRYYHSLDLLSTFLPESKVILLLRNPLDVAASYKNSWEVDLPKLISRKENATGLFDYVLGFNWLMTFAEHNPVLTIHYEDLVSATASELNRIFDYLGVAGQEVSTEIDINLAGHAKASFGDQKILIDRKVHQRSVGAYKTFFSKEEIELLLGALGEDLFARLGYGRCYAQLCQDLQITPEPQECVELLEVVEDYVARRKADCENPGSLSPFEAKIDQLILQLEQIKKRNALRTKDYGEAQTDNNSLEDEQLSEIRSLNHQLVEQLNQIQLDNKQLNEQLSQIQSDNKLFNEQLNQIRDQNEQLQEQLNQIETRNKWSENDFIIPRRVGLRERLRSKLSFSKTFLKHNTYVFLWRLAKGPEKPPLPKITLVTPVFDGAESIESTLRSVLSQDYDSFEYIVVDCASRGNIREMIENIQVNEAVSGRITRISAEPDHGFYSAVARGFSSAAGDVFAYLNAGDVLEPGALSGIGEYFAENPKVSAIYHEDTVLLNGWKYPNVRVPSEVRTPHLIKHGFTFSESIFFRRDAYEAVGGVRRDLRFAGSYDFWLRLSVNRKLVKRPGHVICSRKPPEKSFTDTEAYHREAERARKDFLLTVSPIRRLIWKTQSNIPLIPKFPSRVNGEKYRLLFPTESAELPTSQLGVKEKGYSGARSPIDGKPPERLLFSSADTCVGDQEIHQIYLDTRHEIAITDSPTDMDRFDRPCEKHYALPRSIIEDPQGNSPYLGFDRRSVWEKALLELPVEKVYRAPHDAWKDRTLSEMKLVLKAAKMDVSRTLSCLVAGRFDAPLLDQIRETTSWTVSGLGTYQPAIKICREKGHQVWFGDAGSALEIVPENTNFDVVFMSQGIHRVEDPVRTLRVLRLLLAPGGVLVISTPNLDSREIDWFGPAWSHWAPPFHRYIFSRKGLLALARQAGLKPVCLRTFSNCDWSSMSLGQNQLGLAGSTRNAARFDDRTALRALRSNFWHRLIWNRLGKGDYSYLAVRDTSDD